MSINKSKGFTIVEMIVIAPIAILVIGTFIFVIVTMTGDVMGTRAANVLAYDIQNTLNKIEADYKISKGFLTTDNSIAPSIPQGSDNQAAKFNSANSLIINTFATTDNPLSSTKSLIYTKDTPNPCSSLLVSQNMTLMLNTVYYLKTNTTSNNQTLWRRIVFPLNFNVNQCSPTWQKPTCGQSAPNTYCQVQDMKLITADSIDFKINYDKIGSNPQPGAITVTITTIDKASGRSVNQSGTISVDSLNN